MTTTAVAKKNPIRPSNMNRTCLCPPSPWREQNAAINHVGDDANEGTLLHAAIRCICETGEPPAGLTEEQLGVVKACHALMQSLYSPGDDTQYAMLENSIPMRGSLGADILPRTITPDVVIVNETAITIIDWKTGRLAPDFSVESDLQMQCYAIAARNYYTFHSRRLNRVTVIRFHPRLWDEHRDSRVTIEGSDDDWLALEQNIEAIVARSTPEAEAHPGEAQCRYCKAKLQCSEFQQWSSQFIINVDWEKLPVPVLAQAYKRLVEIQAPLDNAIKDAKAALLTLSETELESNGFKLGNNGADYDIASYITAKGKWKEANLSEQSFDFCASVSVKKLAEAYRQETGCLKTHARELLMNLMGDEITVKERAKSLKVVK